MKRIKLILTSLALLFASMALVATVPATVLASPKSDVCGALNAGSDCDTQPKNGISLNKVVTTLVNLLSVVVGITAVIMIMVSGFKYVTSGGDSNKVASAKNSMIYAIVGLVVVALAQTIVRYVTHKVD